MTVRIGVDTGGTFTDVVLYDDESGTIHTTKTPSTPPDFDRGVLTGIEKILAETDTDPAAVEFLSHGTTVGTNAVLEGDIPPIGLLTNEGLQDVLEIGDQTRPKLYDLQQEKPPALVPRRRRLGVPGRIGHDGEVVDPLDEAAARAAIDDLVDAGAESIVVSMLFSYLNDDHERRVGDLIEERTDLEYALSSAVYPETREYDRTVTTVLNEAVKRNIADYLDRLGGGIEERGIDVPLNVMHSGGGIFSPGQATQFALRTVLSGPAAGAVAASSVSAELGYPNAIGLDMGGTSADVSIVENGELVRSTEGEINDLPIKTPLIDINTVGAGGGSIAWLDSAGGLRVGPRSAGADPGPICYGRGGTEPTVTDANLVLGRLTPEAFVTGDMDPVVDRTRERFTEAIADPLGVSVESAALDVLKVANAKMAREIRRVTVERGRDPTEFALLAFGGAGPMQAPAVAAQMDIDTVILPRNAGVLSARGLLLADVRADESRAFRGQRLDPDTMEEGFADLEAVQADRFAEMGFAAEEVALERAVDVRYVGQSYELTVPAAGTLDDEALDDAVAAFHDAHERLYGYAMPDESVEVVTLRVTGRVPTPPLADRPDRDAGEARRGEREVYFEATGYEPAAIWWRPALSPGASVDGPGIIEDRGNTALLPPDATATVADDGSVLVER
ncbi:hydantoinase/oxoprolinase family protein [Salinigranum salinum]|uniref:hydantoinase/oxoprolinase family protein n=1 Tax=Salinigranum salinum TaxID=1364937 RepID=UPI00126047BD|nr:hydantoinase/oxoprolinase family protein [Salinigranum salinum]